MKTIPVDGGAWASPHQTYAAQPQETREGEPMLVDAATLYKAAKDVDDTQSNITNVQNSMLRVTSEAEARWKGVASSGFQGVMNRWSHDISIVLGALTDIGTLLRQSAAHHTNNDQAQGQMFNKYDSSL
jgi:WXG100 family type VII secretion target